MPAKNSGKKTPRKHLIKNRFLRYLTSAATVMAVLVFFFVFAVYLGIFGPIPSKASLKEVRNNTASLVKSHDGRLIGKYMLENRMSIAHEGISPNVQHALVATEDSRFFKHKGLDFISLGRVFVKSLVLGNRNQGGGSTISQQLARNLYPRLDFGKFTLPVNKVREIFISARLEKVYNKEQILTMYLNTVPFGENVYGIEVASQRFFGKPSSSLSAPEAATLIGMLAANTAYNPRLHPEKSMQRRNTVLARMEDQGFITREDLDRYEQEPIRLRYKKLDYNNGPAPYFVEYIRPKVLSILKEIGKEDLNLYTDGLVITTTLDSTLQEYANEAVHQHIRQLQKEFEAHWSDRDPWKSADPDLLWRTISSSPRYQVLRDLGLTSEEAVAEMRKPVDRIVFDWDSGEGKLKSISPIDSIKQQLRTLQTGFLALNPQNGHLLSWIGGRDFEFFKYDHVLARRQVGSTFKPVLYSAVLQSGIDPCAWYSNEVRVYPDYQDWAPENADGVHVGYYTVKGALANSVNTVSAALIDEIGIQAVIQQARTMGITSDIPEVPSIALGSADLTLYEMIRAYSVFSNLGRLADPVALLKIEDYEGNLLWQAEAASPTEPVMEYETARLMAEMMKGVVDRGTGTSLRWLFGLQGEIAGKTGTTQDNADGWFIGCNSRIVAGAWVGADHPSVHFRTIALGQGAHTGLPMFGRFFQQIERDPQYRQLALAGFPEMSPELSSQLDCQDYSLDNPNMTILEKIYQSLIQADTIKAKELKEPPKVQEKEHEEQKEGFFERMKRIFRKK